MSPPLRASNEALPRARVARAQGTHWGIPPLLADFLSILLGRYANGMLRWGQAERLDRS